MTARLVAAGVAAALLVAGSGAGAGELGWLLAPTAALVECASGVAFVPTGTGAYVSVERGIAIGASCSGIRFLAVAFALGALTTLPRVGRGRPQWVALGAVLCGAWLLAIAANASRIAGAMLVVRLAGGRPEPSAAALHLAVGVAVFSSSLVLYSLVLQRAVSGSGR